MNYYVAFRALTLLVGRQEGHPACKKLEWRGAGVVICLERGADLHTAQLMPLPLTVSCFSKIQTGFTFLVPAHPGSHGKGPLNGCVCVCVYLVDYYISHITLVLELANWSLVQFTSGLNVLLLPVISLLQFDIVVAKRVGSQLLGRHTQTATARND